VIVRCKFTLYRLWFIFLIVLNCIVTPDHYMKLPILIITALFFSLTLQAREGGADKKAATLYNAAATQPQFIENKGQITDQYGAPRKDIDYKLQSGDVTLFVGKGQLHYQWSRAKANSKNEKLNTKLFGDKKSPSGPAAAGRDVEVVSIYRMDVTLLGANRHAEVLAEEPQIYEEHYYRPYADEGAIAHSYKRIIYKNVYPHIDWVLYVESKVESSKSKDEVVSYGAAGIKYDFIVHPGGNVADIQLQYNGATGLALKDGALVATTPMGTLTEAAPYTYMATTGKALASSYVLHGNVLGYDVATTYVAAQPIVIDPTLTWATYYGGTGTASGEGVNDICTDASGNVYMAMATTSSNMATIGAHQTSYGGNNQKDALIVKFNTAGQLQWATYYGGPTTDIARAITCDATGNVYFAGVTNATTGIATTGAYITTAPSNPGMLVKLNSAGVRQWGTYFHADIWDVCYDNFSNSLYLVSSAGASLGGGIATTGAYQTGSGNTSFFRFTTAGAKVWGSFYNGDLFRVVADGQGSIYLAGSTNGTAGIVTTGAYKTTLSSTYDAFLTRFTTAGNQVWGTLFGGAAGNPTEDFFWGMCTDGDGNIYAAGSATSNTLATTGAHQTILGGAQDGLLAKFSRTGSLLWCTYYGGSGVDELEDITIDTKNRIYVSGNTSSSNNIATPGALQTVNMGGSDAYMGVFDVNGVRQYGTYYGGSANEGYGTSDAGTTIAYSSGYIYMGTSTGSNSLATTGAYQLNKSSSTDGLLLQFDLDTFLYIHQPFADTIVCSGDTLSIPYGVTKNFRSSNNFVFELSNAGGSFASGVTTLGTLTAAQTGGVYNYIVPHSTTQSNLYRVRVRSTAPIDTAYELTNVRITTTPQSPTANNNGPVCSSNPLNLASSSTTAGVSYSWSGPSGYTSTAQNPVRNPALTKYSGDYIVTITNANCISKDTAIVVVDSTPIAITAGNNGPLCVGSDLQLTASNTTAGATYNWSGPSFSNTTQNPTINNVGLANAGVYSVYASLGNCNTATATTTVSVVNGPSVNIYPSPNDSICGNTTGSATFVATAINPGGSPSYQWYKNGTLVTTTISNTYTATGIQKGDVFYTKLVPGTGAACNTAVNSNQITMTVMPYLTPSVSISVSPDSTAWSGLMLTFTAKAVNAGNKPTYQWKVNGVSMTGATSNTWGASNLNDKDKVTCEVTSSYICPQPQKVTSNVIGIKIKTGVYNLKSNNISIYPNPTQTTLTVEGVAKGTMIQLKDVLGRQVIHATATQTKTVLNTTQLTAGNYLLILTTTDGEVMTEKVVKE